MRLAHLINIEVVVGLRHVANTATEGFCSVFVSVVKQEICSCPILFPAVVARQRARANEEAVLSFHHVNFPVVVAHLSKRAFALLYCGHQINVAQGIGVTVLCGERAFSCLNLNAEGKMGQTNSGHIHVDLAVWIIDTATSRCYLIVMIFQASGGEVSGRLAVRIVNEQIANLKRPLNVIPQFLPIQKDPHVGALAHKLHHLLLEADCHRCCPCPTVEHLNFPRTVCCRCHSEQPRLPECIPDVFSLHLLMYPVHILDHWESAAHVRVTPDITHSGGRCL